MGIRTTREMFVYELGRTRNLERTGDRMLSEIADRIQDPELPRMLHDEEEARHRLAANFDSCLRSLGISPTEVDAPVVEALRQRFHTFARMEPSPEALDLYALGTALRLAYTVIAGYKELMDLAQILGEHECERCLRENLTHKEQYATRLQRDGQDIRKRLIMDPASAVSR